MRFSVSPLLYILCSLTLLLPLSASSSISITEKQWSQWIKLLHYKGESSTIASPDFFLDENGYFDAEAELVATIRAFTNPAEMAHCRYPARYIWFKENFGSVSGLSLRDCEDYQQWIQFSDTESISLIYVTGYLGNPASFFGHLMMKFNRHGDSKTDIDLLDTGINFGANAKPDDNPVKYILYGIFGGYSANYTTTTYYLHTTSYSENEQRELWEYELNLSQYEVALIQAHLFELKGVDFTYYFLSDNCSTAFQDVLNIVLTQALDTGSQPWDAPIDIFHALPNVKHHEKPLVKKVTQRQSKYSRIQSKYMALSDTEKQQVLIIAKDISKLTPFMMSNLFSDYEKARVLDVLTEYTELLLVTKNKSDANNKEQKRRLLLARIKMDRFVLSWPKSKAQPPHLAQPSINIGMGTGYSENHRGYLSLRGYGAYYDFLSTDVARLKDSALTILDTELHVTNNKIHLKKLDVLNIASLNTNDAELFENDRLAWQLSLSLEQSECQNDDCYRGYFKGYLGFAERGLNEVSAYTMIGGQLDFTDLGDSTLQFPMGVLYKWSERWKTHLRVVPSLGLNLNDWNFNIYSDTRFKINSKTDVRVSIEKSYDNFAGIYYNLYF